LVPRVLLTGPPGVGKTTIVRRVIALLPGLRTAGFYTEEVRGRGGRTGFRVVTLDGRSARLASIGEDGGPRVGRYRVHVGDFEALAVPDIEPSLDVDLVVVDEIGKMECLSAAFVAAARRALTAPVPLLGTVARTGGGLIAEAKVAPGVSVLAVSAANRDRLPAELAARFAADRRLEARD
jgi:nucleoside-triphosphatase